MHHDEIRLGFPYCPRYRIERTHINPGPLTYHRVGDTATHKLSPIVAVQRFNPIEENPAAVGIVSAQTRA
jgi:hypothetical protein